jgi:lysine N6-hydroxylase
MLQNLPYKKMNKKVYDFIGVGIGPFNLGLAALSASIKGLDCLFFDQQEAFQWHPGMLLDHATLQVPFLADLVTLVDPTHPLSFLHYLKEHNRIYQFYIREDFFLLRQEYNHYCRWALSKLPSCRFSHRVDYIAHEAGRYVLEVTNLEDGQTSPYYCRKLVLGTGTSPYLPAAARQLSQEQVFHTSRYLENKSRAQQGASISIIGSGQSAAEIFYDLLVERQHHHYGLNWYTRSDRFFPLEYSKLTLELTSPDFLDYFYHLPPGKKDQLVPGQKNLYKGIDFDLINAIYDELYRQTIPQQAIDVSMCPGVALTGLREKGPGLEMDFYHQGQEVGFKAQSEVVILATGYRYQEPGFMQGIKDRIRRDEKGRYRVSRDFAIDHGEQEIFVQNAELHTHGFITPDLGMAPLHNATILNQILGREHFVLEKNTAFQTFGLPVKQPVEAKVWADEVLWG